MKLSERLNALLSSLDTRTRGSRVRHEAEGLLAETFMGTIIWTVFVVLIHWMVLCAALYGVFLSLRYALPAPSCVEHCFSKRSEECCPGEVLFVLRSIVLILLLFYGSYVSTKLSERRRTRHSAALAVLILASWLFIATRLGYSLVTLLGVSAVIYFAIYFSYRLSFK